jgi:cephalosporin hydroxylase
MTVKNLIPRSLRDHLRPGFQSCSKWCAGRIRSLQDSVLWPKPSAWHTVRKELEGISDSAVLYDYAEKEFGILQIRNEIVPFLDFVAKSEPRVIGEIGIKHGGNSFMFLRKFTNARLYLGVDLVLQNTGKLRFLRRAGQCLHISEGNSQGDTCVRNSRRILAGRQFDFLFIDGDHEYHGVLEDLIQWYPLVRPGGLIAFHDIVPDEEVRTGKRSEGNLLWGGGVHKLWDRLKPHFSNQEFVESWDQGGFGIGVITKPDDNPLSPELIAALKAV